MFNCCNNYIFAYNPAAIFNPFMAAMTGNGFWNNLSACFMLKIFNNARYSECNNYVYNDSNSYNYPMQYDGCIFNYNLPQVYSPSSYEIPENTYNTNFNYAQNYSAGTAINTDVFQKTFNFTPTPVITAPIQHVSNTQSEGNRTASSDSTTLNSDETDVSASNPLSDAPLPNENYPASYAITPESDYAAIYNRTYTGDCINTGQVIHFRYDDANLSNRKSMQPAAKAAFDRMAAAMKRDLGFTLGYSSAYRSRNDQIRSLNNKTYNNNVGVMKNRFVAVAPVGYSEHHTGYACDITIDGQNGDLENINWQTGKLKQAYDWMKEHAVEYGFEQSFRAGNKQGVMEEAWHYRWVGDADSQKVFERARRYEGII